MKSVWRNFPGGRLSSIDLIDGLGNDFFEKPDRRELKLWHDLIHFTDRMNRTVLMLGLLLQNKSMEGSSLNLTVSDIKTKVIEIMNYPMESLIEKTINHFPYTSLISNGTDVYGVYTSCIIKDIDNTKQAKTIISTNLDAATTLSELADIGIQVENLPFSLDVVLAEIYEPPIFRMVDDCHDLLDSLSYEYLGRNSQNGIEGIVDFDRMRKLSVNRLLSFDIARGVYESNIDVPVDSKFALDKKKLRDDMLSLTTIKDYIESHWQDCQNVGDFAVLGNYISSNLPKLPLVRRHWSI